jgi:hypothetical protein
MSKKSGKSIKEKRLARKAGAEGRSPLEQQPRDKRH